MDDAPFPALIENAQVPGENEVKIPVELAGRIAVLLRKHAEGEARTRKKSAVLFDALKKEAGIATGGAQYTVKRWDFVRDWAVKNAHVAPKGPKCTHAEMQDRFNEFERILYALVASFVDVLGDVDRILLAAPSEENIDAVIALLSRGGARNYFFERENDPEWLRALDEKKYFDDLLEGEHWPESAFLTRMATREPERVTQILERLTKKRGTIVKIHLIDIATALPPSHATRLTKRIAEIADAELRPFTRWYGFGLPKLIVHLAGGGEGNAAFRLFDAMYSVRRTRSGGVSEEVSFTGTSNDLWQLQEGLKSILPALAAVNAKMLIQSLFSKLKAAAEARGYLGPNFDWSHMIGWCPTGEEDGPAPEIAYDLESLFASAIFQAAKLAIRSGFISADEAVGLIECKQGHIFKLIFLHLLVSVAPEASEKAVAIMTKPAEFEQPFLADSFGQLLQVRFAELSLEQRKSVLGWIRKGRNFEDFVSRYQQVHSGKPTAEEWEGVRKNWLRDRLKWIPAELLPPTDLELLKQIEAEVAPDESKGMLVGVQASPKTLDELRAMSAEEIADFLKLNPPEEGRGPTSKLAPVLSQAVQERVAEFSGAARAYVGVHQSWIRSLLWGLDSQAKQGTEIDWEPLLALCAWVVEQPRGEEPRDRVGNGDVSWEGARGFVADIFRDGLQNAKAVIPPALGSPLWAILEQLAEDPDPTVEYERGQAFEPAMLSINSVRGKAMHAIIQYALWRRRRMNDEGVTGGFDTMPEVRALLDGHLERDPSPAVRSVYAQYFPALVYLDANWAAAVAPLVFPASEEDVRFWRAAWSAYAIFAQTFDKVFDILRPTYELAVQRMPWSENPETPSGRDGENWRHAEENVARHLLAFYWRGKLELAENSLLVRFYERSALYSRSAAMRFVANNLASYKGDVPADVQQRMMALWEWRMKVLEKPSNSKEREELASFGGWFAHGKLDPEWSARMLLDVLKLTDHVDHPEMVIVRLAAIATTDLKRAVDCLEAFIAADREGWRHTMAKDQVEAILQASLKSDEPAITRSARNIVDKLAERGDISYRALLP